MPYVCINCFPRDEETKKAMAEKVNAAMMEALGCQPGALTIEINDKMTHEDWDHIKNEELPKKMDQVMILSGQKFY